MFIFLEIHILLFFNNNTNTQIKNIYKMEGFIEEKPLSNLTGSIYIKGLELILFQMKNCVCKVYSDGMKSTGFFCKIPFPDKSHLFPVLLPLFIL